MDFSVICSLPKAHQLLLSTKTNIICPLHLSTTSPFVFTRMIARVHSFHAQWLGPLIILLDHHGLQLVTFRHSLSFFLGDDHQWSRQTIRRQPYLSTSFSTSPLHSFSLFEHQSAFVQTFSLSHMSSSISIISVRNFIFKSNGKSN